MNWWGYVERIAPGVALGEIAKAAQVSGPTVSRWRQGTQGVDGHSAVSLARAYGQPPTGALVAAGFLTAEEAKERPMAAPSLDSLSDEELMAELRTRLEERGQRQQNKITREVIGGVMPTETRGPKREQRSPRR